MVSPAYFALLSIEEGLARTALEAIACGIPAVLTPNTGTSDFIQPGVNGEIVPIRDATAAADAIVKCYDRRLAATVVPDATPITDNLSFERFRHRLQNHLAIFDTTSE